MEDNRTMGVFGTIRNQEENQSSTTKVTDLEVLSEENPNTIYNLLFREYDEGKTE
jgi:hypothetical protein